MIHWISSYIDLNCKFVRQVRNRAHNEEKNQLIEADAELTKILNLVDKYLKIVGTLFCMLKWLKERLNMFNKGL